MPAGDPRGTAEFKRLTIRVCNEEPVCWLQLEGCTYYSTSADHVIPVIERPDLALVRSNLRGACRHCNQKRGKKPAPEQLEAAPGLDIFD